MISIQSKIASRVRPRGIMAVALLLLGMALPMSAETLRVVTWGGAYAKSQILGFIRDYEEKTGVTVEVLEYSGGIGEIRSQVRSHNVRWDVVDFELFDAIRAAGERLLEPINPDQLAPAADGASAREDFIEGSLLPHGVGNIVFSKVIAHRRGTPAPSRLEDLFNLSDFPGDRALRRTPVGNLEWALLADGVDPESIYSTLETSEGLQRAFRKLDRVKAVTRWWTDGEQAIAWLESGDVAMGSVYNGRVFDANRRGADLDILWDRQITFMDVWGIPRNGRNTERAFDFIRFATSTRSLANQTKYISYGPVRKSSMAHVADEIRPYLPTAAENLAQAFHSNPEWWSRHYDHVNSRFESWLRTPVRVPQRLPR